MLTGAHSTFARCACCVVFSRCLRALIVYCSRRLSPYLTVVEARHGQEALNVFETAKVKPNLVLSDVMMPGTYVRWSQYLTGSLSLAAVMDGWALVEALRSRKDYRKYEMPCLSTQINGVFRPDPHHPAHCARG